MSDERDACALVSIARKDGRPTREVLDGVLGGMAALAHRSGLVDGAVSYTHLTLPTIYSV